MLCSTVRARHSRSMPREPSVRCGHSCSMAQPEVLDHLQIPRVIGSAKVLEQASPLAHHEDQSSAGSVILPVSLQMLRQRVNPRRQQCDLHFRRSRVALVTLQFFQYLPAHCTLHECARFRLGSSRCLVFAGRSVPDGAPSVKSKLERARGGPADPAAQSRAKSSLRGIVRLGPGFAHSTCQATSFTRSLVI